MSSSVFGMSISAEATAEIDAVFSVYGNDEGCMHLKHLHESAIVILTYTPRGSACRVTFEISSGYPHQTPINYRVELISGAAENRALLKEVVEILNNLRDDRAICGEGVLFDMIEAVKMFESFSENQQDAVEDICNKNEKREAIDIDEIITVVYIDHMNEASRYVKTLKKWCNASMLSGRIFFKQPADKSKEKRKEGVYLCLKGSHEGTKCFLGKLRTELLDVDSKGKKCKERKSSVIGSRPVTELTIDRFHRGLFVQDNAYTDYDSLIEQFSLYVKNPALVGVERHLDA